MEARRGQKLRPNCAAVDWLGMIPPAHPGHEMKGLFGIRAGWWKAGRDQKSPIRRCFKSRPPLRTRCAGSPPAASHGCKEVKSPSTASLERDAGRFKFCTRLKETLGFFIPWRLSGLLSGYLPTDTRPQARAKLGKSANRAFESASQHFFCAADRFLHSVTLVARARPPKMNGC